jgi:gluconate 5-dehydrogenase
MDNNIFNLKGKTIVVTGSNGQLGTSICEFLLNIGSVVIGIDLKDNKKNNLAKFYNLDISISKNVESVFKKIFNEFGRIDVLINNAGVSTFEPFENRSEEKFDWVMDVNLKGSFNCIQSFVNLFDINSQDKSSIINIASMYGLISPDFRIYTDLDRKNSEVYGASKAGIIQMSKYFAVHLADRNIRCNSVSPGGIFNPNNPQGKDFISKYSERCPMKRMANSEEIVGAIVYLASDLASYTTGQNITVDGGMSAW